MLYACWTAAWRQSEGSKALTKSSHSEKGIVWGDGRNTWKRSDSWQGFFGVSLYQWGALKNGEPHRETKLDAGCRPTPQYDVGLFDRCMEGEIGKQDAD